MFRLTREIVSHAPSPFSIWNPVDKAFVYPEVNPEGLADSADAMARSAWKVSSTYNLSRYFQDPTFIGAVEIDGPEFVSNHPRVSPFSFYQNFALSVRSGRGYRSYVALARVRLSAAEDSGAWYVVYIRTRDTWRALSNASFEPNGIATSWEVMSGSDNRLKGRSLEYDQNGSRFSGGQFPSVINFTARRGVFRDTSTLIPEPEAWQRDSSGDWRRVSWKAGQAEVYLAPYAHNLIAPIGEVHVPARKPDFRTVPLEGEEIRYDSLPKRWRWVT